MIGAPPHFEGTWYWSTHFHLHKPSIGHAKVFVQLANLNFFLRKNVRKCLKVSSKIPKIIFFEYIVLKGIGKTLNLTLFLLKYLVLSVCGMHIFIPTQSAYRVMSNKSNGKLVEQ